jgi:SepF-like predicted cell division protein (DUF552 family)
MEQREQTSFIKHKVYSLKDVVNYPSKIQSTAGVILDSTGTYKSNNSFDYVTKLRIIDNTHNNAMQKKN